MVGSGYNCAMVCSKGGTGIKIPDRYLRSVLLGLVKMFLEVSTIPVDCLLVNGLLESILILNSKYSIFLHYKSRRKPLLSTGTLINFPLDIALSHSSRGLRLEGCWAMAHGLKILKPKPWAVEALLACGWLWARLSSASGLERSGPEHTRTFDEDIEDNVQVWLYEDHPTK